MIEPGKERSADAAKETEGGGGGRGNFDEAHSELREERETAGGFSQPIIGAAQQTGTALVEASLLLLSQDANEKTSTSGTNTRAADAREQAEAATRAPRGDVCSSCGETRYDDGAKREITLIGRVDECGLMRRCAFATCNTHDERRRRREEQLRSSSNEPQLEQPMQHFAAQAGAQSKEGHLQAHFCAGSCGSLSVAAQLWQEPAGNVKNGVSERLSGDLNWQSISRAEPQAAASEERAAQSVVSVPSGAPSACLASQSATPSGRTQRELEVEWTSGAEGRSLFRHALKSSVVEASCNQCSRQPASTATNLVKTLRYKRIQSGGEAIGRTIKNFVHQLSGGAKSSTQQKSARKAVEQLESQLPVNSQAPFAVGLSDSSLLLPGQVGAGHKGSINEDDNCELLHNPRSSSPLAKEDKAEEKNSKIGGLFRSSVSYHSSLNKQFHYSSNNHVDSSAAGFEQSKQEPLTSSSRLNQQKDLSCGEHHLSNIEPSSANLRSTSSSNINKSPSNWTTTNTATVVEQGSATRSRALASACVKRESLTSEDCFVRNKYIIEDKVRIQQHQASAIGNKCTATPSSRNLEDRRSTYCSSIGIVTSDLNYDSSFSSVNNCSESNNTCGAMLPHHGSSRGLNANLNQEQQQQRQQYQTHAQQTTTTATTATSSLDRPRNFDDCGKDPSNNNAIPVGLILSNKKRKTKPVGGLKERENWDKNIEFLLAVIGFAVDLGNVWRFPYICYKNGGGAFLIPYTIMFILGGLPIFYLEMSLGQYFSSGCLTVWLRVCPMAKGIGYAMCVLNFFTGLYYNTIISWAVFFFVESFTPVLPWTRCDNHWNSAGCRTIDQRQAMNVSHLGSNLTMPAPINNATSLIRPNQYTTPTQDYFEREVLQIHRSSGIHDLGDVRTPLAIYLAIVFVCIYFAIWKGVKSTGKAVWITALLPYFVLIPLLIRGVFLKGAWLGIKYYLYPQWMKITDVDVWVEAAKQIYFSLGPGFGTLMALSSYNKFNHNCCRDTLIAASVNYFASFIAGLVIFAVLGYMATILGVDISNVATEGPGLVFQVYPEGLAMMRFSSMWSVLFFIMVITLGIDSTNDLLHNVQRFGGLESVITGLCDEYPRVLRAHRGIFIGILIVVIYLCSLPTTTYGGNYVIYLLESYGTSLSLLFIVLVETIIVCWVYGAERFCKNLQEMNGKRPGAYWRICWKYISPTILLLIFVAACGQELDKYHTLTNADYTYPSWAPTIGLLMTGSSVCCIPIYAIYYLKTKVSGTFCQRLKVASKPVELRDQQREKDIYVDALIDKIGDEDDIHLDAVI